jgi:hypothetical protein
MLKNCKYYPGDQIMVSNETLIFSVPFETRFVDFKKGYIETVLPRIPNTNPPYICLYNLVFDDLTKAIEVPEYKIKRQSNSLIPVKYDTLQMINDLALINNMNLSKNKRKLDYQDLNEDKKLQDDVVVYYHNKTIRWLDENEEFKKVKKHLKFIKSTNGLNFIKTALKLYIKKYDTKWYELRDDINYDNVKEYIRKHLTTI